MNITIDLQMLRMMQQGLSDGICKIAQVLEIDTLTSYKETIAQTIHEEYRAFRDFHIWQADLDTIDLAFLEMILPLFQAYANESRYDGDVK